MMREARRTVALRSGSSGYTPPSTTPTSNVCLNCGSTVQLQYCPECGQRAGDPDPTLREFVQELASELLNWDGKLWATVSLLVRKPGMLTAEYLAGRRARYVAPLRLYLSASVLYFFVTAVVPHAQDNDLVQFGPTETVTTHPSSPPAALQVTSSASGQARGAHPPASGVRGTFARFGARVGDGAKRAAKDHRAFAALVRSQLATTVFLILPAFAFAVGLAYRRERRHYPQHVVFALHVHTLAFVLFALTALSDITGKTSIEDVAKAIGFALLLSYVVIALRRVYGGDWWRTIAKAALLSIVYLMFFAAGTATLVAYDFYTF